MGAAEGSRAGADASPEACEGGLPPPEAWRCRFTSSAIAAAKTSNIICTSGIRTLVSPTPRLCGRPPEQARGRLEERGLACGRHLPWG